MSRARMVRSTVTAVALGLGVSACWAQPRSLVAPPGFLAAVGDEQRQVMDCPAAPEPYTGALDFPSKYQGSDAARDDFNAQSNARYKAQTRDITALEKGVARMVGRYLDSGQSSYLNCTMSWLTAWAEADALRGQVQSHTGKSMRKWALGSLASAYLQLKSSSSDPLRLAPSSARKVEDWFGRLADQVVEDWRDQPLRKVNNHEYWAAWSVMAVAVILDRQDLFDWSVSQYRIAAGQIDERGFLPNELARDTRALFYHNYALPPLAMIAAFAQANGVPLIEEGDGALHRLARRVMDGVERPEAFREITGSDQNLEDLNRSSKYSWLEPYCWMTECSPLMRRRLEEFRPINTYRMGGDVTRLFANAGHGDGALALR